MTNVVMTEYEKKLKLELLQQLPPSSQNNERKYWGRKIEKWYETKNPDIGEEIACRFGLDFHFKSGFDYGNLPNKN
jgi:hypothetical protein